MTIVGEALNRLMKIDPSITSQITDSRQIIAFRNILVHGYDIVRNEVVWGILEKDLPTLIAEVSDYWSKGEPRRCSRVLRSGCSDLPRD